MTDKIQQARRAAFEEWAVTRRHPTNGLPFFVMKNESGKYLDGTTEYAWEGFNAALDCVVIELPDPCRQVTFDDEGIDIYWPDEVRTAIESTNLGIKVK